MPLTHARHRWVRVRTSTALTRRSDPPSVSTPPGRLHPIPLARHPYSRPHHVRRHYECVRRMRDEVSLSVRNAASDFPLYGKPDALGISRTALHQDRPRQPRPMRLVTAGARGRCGSDQLCVHGSIAAIWASHALVGRPARSRAARRGRNPSPISTVRSASS